MQKIKINDKDITPGMRSSLLKKMTAERNVEGAMEAYFILKADKNFVIDTYKVVDLCELLAQNKRVKGKVPFFFTLIVHNNFFTYF